MQKQILYHLEEDDINHINNIDISDIKIEYKRNEYLLKKDWTKLSSDDLTKYIIELRSSLRNYQIITANTFSLCECLDDSLKNIKNQNNKNKLQPNIEMLEASKFETLPIKVITKYKQYSNVPFDFHMDKSYYMITCTFDPNRFYDIENSSYDQQEKYIYYYVIDLFNQFDIDNSVMTTEVCHGREVLHVHGLLMTNYPEKLKTHALKWYSLKANNKVCIDIKEVTDLVGAYEYVCKIDHNAPNYNKQFFYKKKSSFFISQKIFSQV